MNHYQYRNYHLYRKFSPMDVLKLTNENEEFVRDHQQMHYYFHLMRMELFQGLAEVTCQVLLVHHPKMNSKW